MVILRQCIIASSAAMVNVSFGFVEKNLQNLLNHTKNAMQKVNCFTLRCFSYIIVDKKQGRSKFFSVRELVLTMSIGNQISAIRNEQQLTQEQFGELFHVTRQTVSNWENEKNYPDLQILIAMSNQFDVSLDTLLKGDSKMVKAIDKERVLGKIKHEKLLVDFFTGAGTGLVASCFLSSASTIRTVVMIVGFVMIGIGWYKRAKSDKEVFKYMEERGQE